MNQDAKQMREHCQKILITLDDSAIAPADKMKSMIVILGQMQMRLTLLEGATLQTLAGITNE